MAVEQSISKKCTRCMAVLPVSSFPLCRGVPRARCKPCHVNDAVEYAAKNRETRRVYQRQWMAEVRAKERGPDWTPKKRVSKLTPEERAARGKAYRKKWDLANPHRIAEKTRRYQSAKRNAWVRWASPEAMAQFYADARRLTVETGVPHEVDHIVPLVHPLVCGLHCEANLQVIPMAANRSKANRVWPGMP